MGSCHSPEADLPHSNTKVSALPKAKLELNPTTILIMPNSQ